MKFGATSPTRRVETGGGCAVGTRATTISSEHEMVVAHVVARGYLHRFAVRSSRAAACGGAASRLPPPIDLRRFAAGRLGTGARCAQVRVGARPALSWAVFGATSPTRRVETGGGCAVGTQTTIISSEHEMIVARETETRRGAAGHPRQPPAALQNGAGLSKVTRLLVSGSLKLSMLAWSIRRPLAVSSP